MKKGFSNVKPVVEEKSSRATSLEEVEIVGEKGKFFKGYAADGTPIYVPAGNLESMRSFVNMNLMPEYSTEKEELKKYEEKLEHLVDKLEGFLEDDYVIEEVDERESFAKDSQLIHKIKPSLKRPKRKEKKFSTFKIEINIKKFRQKYRNKDEVRVGDLLEKRIENVTKNCEDSPCVTQESRKSVNNEKARKNKSIATEVSKSHKKSRSLLMKDHGKDRDKKTKSRKRSILDGLRDICSLL